MRSVLQDIRFGSRILWRSPGITLAVILALALGIGANAAMFSVVDALLLHPLRYPEASKLVAIWDRDAQGLTWTCSGPNFLELRKAKTLSEIGAWARAPFDVQGTGSGADRPVRVIGARVTSGFFRALGVKPALGRTFLAEEDGLDPGTQVRRVAVIGYQLWQGALGGDPNILGRTILLNEEIPYTVIGVMPADFQFRERGHQLWVPARLNADRSYRYLTVIGRPAVSREATGSEMNALARQLAERYPDSDRGWGIQVDNFQEWLVDRLLRTRLLLLFAAVGSILLLACTNVAGLLFVRSAARKREIGVRLSMGATPARVLRQLLTESVLLALIGGSLGLGLAGLLIKAAPRFVPASAIPTTSPIELNPLVLYFGLAISVLTGIVFGLAPGLSLSRTDLRGTLNDSSRGATGGRGTQRFRQATVMVQVAFALVLLASAGLMAESLHRLGETDVGFGVENVLTLRVFLPSGRYDAARALAFHRQAMDKVAALPGVASVAMGSNLPLSDLTAEVPFDLDSVPPRDSGLRPTVGYVSISPGYLSTLEIPLKRGRGFSDADSETSPPVAIVNEAFVALHFPNENPVGRRLQLNPPVLGKNGFADTGAVEIVGVTGNVKLNDLVAKPTPIVYVPLAQSVWSAVNWLAVRTRTNPAGLSAPIRKELADFDRTLPVDQTSSMEQAFDDQFAEPRFQARMMSAFAVLALVLAVVGIYGVNAYIVIQRRREFGIRVALGASPTELLRTAVGQGMMLAGIGIALGLGGAFALHSVLSNLLIGVSATDPVMLLSASVFLALIAGVACYLPARQVLRTDPASALRQD